MSETTDLVETGAQDAAGTGEAPAASGTTGSARRRGNGLSGMLLPELQRLAAELGISGTGRMRKGDLVAAISARQVGGESANGSVPAPAASTGAAAGVSAGAAAGVSAGAAADGAPAPPPTCRAEMAATRSPLRIRPVPEMPSSPARRCSSGSSIPDRPLPRRRALPVVPEAADASVVPAAACAPVSTRSEVSLTYRSFPAVNLRVPAQGVPRPSGVRPGGGDTEGDGSKKCEADQRRREIVCFGPARGSPEWAATP